ncbi:hypothetical protein [Mesorhizobium sp. BR1-1-7]|uniref:hypothetical protein n=1 Tax=Mesorhizobium sp. BR1-1-7 TaxID=2876647 RepID=UPI00398D0E9F
MHEIAGSKLHIVPHLRHSILTEAPDLVGGDDGFPVRLTAIGKPKISGGELGTRSIRKGIGDAKGIGRSVCRANLNAADEFTRHFQEVMLAWC